MNQEINPQGVNSKYSGRQAPPVPPVSFTSAVSQTPNAASAFPPPPPPPGYTLVSSPSISNAPVPPASTVSDSVAASIASILTHASPTSIASSSVAASTSVTQDPPLAIPPTHISAAASFSTASMPPAPVVYAPAYSAPEYFAPPMSNPERYGTPLSSQKPYSPKEIVSVESWIGRNVIGVIASILVFLGIIFFGFLVVPSLGDAVKIILMFTLSGILTTTGTALTLSKKNSFTTALLGCGCGAFFISIMLTHAFFHAISDVLAFGLLLVWLTGSLGLVKLSNSMLMSVISHVGMVVSLCFAYTLGMSEDKLALILAYHALSVGLIVVGNKLCYEKTLKLGLFASLLMSLVAVSTMLFFYYNAHIIVEPKQIIYAIAAFSIQLIGALVISVSLVRSIIQVEDKSLQLILHLLNTALMCAIVLVCLHRLPLYFTEPIYPSKIFIGYSYISLAVSSICTVVFMTIYLLSMLKLSKVLCADIIFERISVIGSCVVIGLVCFYFYFLAAVFYPSYFRISGFMLIVLLLVASHRITRDKAFLMSAMGVLAFDFYIMIMDGYMILVFAGTVAAGLAYLALFTLVLVYLWSQFDENEKASRKIFKVLALISVEISMFVIFTEGHSQMVFASLIVTFGSLELFRRRFDARNVEQAGLWIFMRIHELIIVLVNCWVIAFEKGSGSMQALYVILPIASIALLSCSLQSITQVGKEKSWLGIFPGVAFTAVVLATFDGLSTWLNESYVTSLVLMACALSCIIAGFVTHLKSIRVYGLIVVVCCVLKLVTFDLGDAETIMRVVAFIAGGLICFGISALYTYAVKRFDVPRCQ